MTPSLVILAAGIGSRYGGIKQLDGFGPTGQKIIDYTVYDAMRAGFGKIIFVIRHEIKEDFHREVLSHWEGKGDFRVVFQELGALPEGYMLPEGRVKPWGTAHATWMAEKEIQEPFAIANADDFYGYQSLRKMADYLKGLDNSEHGACLIGYEVGKTLTEFGSVSRGVCQADQNGYLTEVIERTKITRNGDGRIFFEEDDERTYIADDTMVSMNLIGFSVRVFEEIAHGFDAVYQGAKENPKREYYVPSVLNSLVEKGVNAPVIPTDDQWFGVTYVEDKSWVREQFQRLHKAGQYPDLLWG